MNSPTLGRGLETPDAERIAELHDWLRQEGEPARAVEPLAGDLSPRRYFRVTLERGRTEIAVWYPADLREVEERFLRARDLLADCGVRVPGLRCRCPELGWVLLEDLGRETLYERRHRGWAYLTGELERAVEAAERVAALDWEAVVALGSPSLDRALLRRELDQTERCLFVPCGLYDDSGFARAMSECFDALAAALGKLPARPCHRDFMARNLIPQPDGPIGVVDFQDLRLGPPGYDLASLFHDSLFVPARIEAELVERCFFARAATELDHRRVVAQRCFKATGTFASFAQRGARRHVPLIEPTLERAIAAMRRLPEGVELVGHLTPRLRPALARGGFC